MQNVNRFLARGGAATLQGVALAGIALVGLMLFVVLVTAGSLIGVGAGLFLLPPLVVTTQRLANLQRRMAGEWSGVRIPVPYRPSPDDDAARSPLRRLYHLCSVTGRTGATRSGCSWTARSASCSPPLHWR